MNHDSRSTSTAPPSALKRIFTRRSLLKLWAIEKIKANYYQTTLGPSWLIIQPLLTTLVFTIAFTVIARIGPRGAPYPLFFLVGYVPWSFFSTSVGRASTSITSNLQIITHYAFPRELLVLATLVSCLPELVVGFVFIAVLALVYGVTPHALVVCVVPILLAQLMLTLGIAFWLASANALWRDTQSLLPSGLRAIFYFSPIIYPLEYVPDSVAGIYLLNPLAAFTAGLRDALFASAFRYPGALLVASMVSLAVLTSGYWVFRSQEWRFADVI